MRTGDSARLRQLQQDKDDAARFGFALMASTAPVQAETCQALLDDMEEQTEALRRKGQMNQVLERTRDDLLRAMARKSVEVNEDWAERLQELIAADQKAAEDRRFWADRARRLRQHIRDFDNQEVARNTSSPHSKASGREV